MDEFTQLIQLPKKVFKQEPLASQKLIMFNFHEVYKFFFLVTQYVEIHREALENLKSFFKSIFVNQNVVE